MAFVAESWEDLQTFGASKSTKKPKVRKPEEVWYDVHKHPEGVPGGMGRSPEHHLRGRGWRSHEIHGATNKTIQYHNPKYPDFVISYGGGSGTKPDHNFGITYLGTNTNVPKKHRAYSVAEAMNKVEELHQLQAGHIVLPMTHAAYSTRVPSVSSQPSVSQQGTYVAPVLPKMRRDMNHDPHDHPIGPPEIDLPTQPDRASDWPKKQKPQVQEIKPPVPKSKPKPAAAPKPTTTKQQTLKYGVRETWEEA